MNRTKLTVILLALMALAGNVAFGQFTYYGLNAQYVHAPSGNAQFVTSFDFLKQVSAHHGFGAELGVPFYLNSNPGKGYETDLLYDAKMIWKRSMLPYLGVRYRLFLGNSFFIGTSLNFGILKERFFADRYYRAPLTTNEQPVNAVYVDYNLKSPFLRWNFETGFIFNAGERMYVTLQGRLGMQVTKPKVTQFADFAINSTTEVEFVPVQGVQPIGGALLGLGLKL